MHLPRSSSRTIAVGPLAPHAPFPRGFRGGDLRSSTHAQPLPRQTNWSGGAVVFDMHCQKSKPAADVVIVAVVKFFEDRSSFLLFQSRLPRGASTTPKVCPCSQAASPRTTKLAKRSESPARSGGGSLPAVAMESSVQGGANDSISKGRALIQVSTKFCTLVLPRSKQEPHRRSKGVATVSPASAKATVSRAVPVQSSSM